MDVEIPERGLARLDVFVRRRLAVKRMTWAGFAETAALSRATLHRAVKQSREMRPATLAKIDVALDWPIGTSAHVIDGGTPPIDEAYRGDHAQVDARLQHIEHLLVELNSGVTALNNRFYTPASADA